jgi:hypothetical protein
MKVFISWSKARSKAAATALREWLHRTLQEVDPWMSETDVEAGAQWGQELTKQLKETKFAILCLTYDGMDAPWLLFEAGAIANQLENPRVCPYLIDLNYSDVRLPLAQFQAKVADKSGTFALVTTINNYLARQLSESDLSATFEKWWPDLDAKLTKAKAVGEHKKPKRDQESMLEEVLDLTRGTARSAASIEERLTTLQERLAIAEKERSEAVVFGTRMFSYGQRPPYPSPSTLMSLGEGDYAKYSTPGTGPGGSTSFHVSE